MINLEWFFATFTPSGHKNKEIDEFFYKFLTLAPQFVALPQEKIWKIFKNRFWPSNLYRLRHSKSHDNIYRNWIVIEDSILQIEMVKRCYQEYSNNKANESETFLNFMSIVA